MLLYVVWKWVLNTFWACSLKGQLLCLMEDNHTPSNEAGLDTFVAQRNPFISMTARLDVEISTDCIREH